MRRIAVISVSVMLMATMSHGSALQAERVAASARWLVHVDVEALASSHLGTALMAQIPAEHTARLDEFKTKFGMDPLKDISAVTLYGESTVHEKAIVLIRGKFNAEKLAALIKAHPPTEQISFGGLTINKWPHDGKDGYSCLYGNDTVVMGGDLEQVKAALNVIGGSQPHMVGSSVLGKLIPSTAGVFFFASADGLDAMQGMRPNAAILKNSKNACLVVREQGDELQAQMKLTADGAEATEQIANVIRGMIAFGMLSQEQNPIMAKMAQAAKLSVENDQVSLTLAFPSADVAAMIKASRGMCKPGPGRRHNGRRPQQPAE